MRDALATFAASLAALALAPSPALAHGFVGQRFFPATIATDDPFVSDELSLPTVSSVRSNATEDEPASRQTTVSGELAKRITADFGISVGVLHQRIAPEGQTKASGWGNVELGAKYQFYKNEEHEALVSAGLNWEIGGSGSQSVGADKFNTFTPTLFFGKGFGDLTTPSLRPLAFTGTLGVAIPSRSSTTTTSVNADTGETVSTAERNPHVLQIGLALEYSLPYLQSVVKDVGLREPFSRMIPVVEFALEKPLDRVDDKSVTGTVNPGVLWAGRKVQLGLEAVIPINHRSGRGVGWQAQLHFFLDDLFPNSFGRPLIGGVR
jgi:hypothetical protein